MRWLRDSVYALPSGTYKFTISNNITLCESDSISITISDDTENPLIELVTLSDDTFCDPTADTGDGQLEVKITGTPGIDVTEYLFRWWAGTDTTIAAMEITNAANFGGTIDVTAADSSAIEGLPSGKYTVVAYDANDPYNGCKSVATYTLKEDNPVYQIKLADIVTKDNDNCTGTTNGYIAIREIYVDGVAVDLATNGTDYTFTWSGNTTAGDGTLETVNAVGDSIGTVGAGTYTVFVTNTSAGGNACSSASVSVTIADDTENPLIELVTLSDDTFCDPTADTGDGQLEVKITGTPGIDVTEYLFRWWAGTDTTIAAMEITNAANFGGTIDVTAADSSAIEGLPSGKYTVVAYDANDPYNGCKSVATYTLKEDNPVYQIKLADIVTKDNDNCTGTTNGYIAIREIYVDGVAVDLATNGTDYTFTWSGNTTAGDGTLETVNAVGDSIGTVGAGTYTVFVTNTSAGGNACSSASVSVTIADDTENPLIELVTLSDDTFCDPTADTGDGQLEVKITGTPGIDVTEYLFRWWAGTDTTIAAMEITNAANFGGTIDVTAADSSAIEGLPSGKYTVVAYDANDPYNGCKSVATYTLKEDNPVYQIKLADIVTKDNDNCTGTTNGYIAIREIYVDGVAVDLATNGTDYTFTWSGNTTAGDGTLETVNAVGDSIGTVGAGTYTVFVTNTSAGGNACSSASVSVTIADDTENPLIELVTLSDDTFCDPTADTGDGQLEVKITGTPGIDVTEYLFRWWAGTDTTIAAMEITNAANFGGTIDVTAADSSAIEGLPSGKYTVVAYDANDPYNGCKSVATYTLKEDNPVYQIKLADIVTKDNDNCTGTTNGYIAIREIYVDGVAVDLATNGTDYTFTWSGNTTAGDGTLETVNAVGDSIGTVGAGTYTVFVTNTSAGGNACSSASVSVTIADDTENPLIELVTLSDDTFCDPTADTGDGQLEVKITGTPGIDVTEYLFRWWAGTDTTIAAMEITNAANFGGTIDVTAADSSAIEGLPSGKYTVVAYDANDPYNGCKSVATYTLKEDNPVYQIKLADIVTKDNDNCTGTTNGYIAIREIYVDGVAVDLATNGTDYTFTWSGNTTAGDGTLETVNAVGDSIGTVGAGTYTVFVTNTSAGGNACSSASVSVTIADDTENPLIELVTLSDDTFCDPTADTGDGQLEVKITGTPGIDVTEYLFRWWAGTDTTIAAMEITNAANFGGTIDVTAADSSAIEGLPSGKYTVVAYDANDPYNGCKSVATYTLKEDNPVYQIKLADIVTKDNDNCTGTTNGYIAIREIYVDGVAVDLATNGTDYTFTWSGNTTAGDGTLETVNAVGDSIGTVGAGTYTVFVTNTSAGGNACSSASVSVTIADDTENPLIELVTLSDDTFCDPTADTGDGQLEVKITGTPGIDVTEYLFRWWAGTDTTIAAMEITNAANFGGTIDVTAADSSAIEGLPSGKYTVVAYDANDPYNGCKSVATYTLKEDNPVYQIKLADIVTKDNDNCTGTTNGYIAIREIYVDGVAVDLATNGTDYTFTWSGNTTAGDGTLETVNAVGDSIGTVGAGTYTVFVTNTSAGGNACSSASVSVTIADDTENPLIELVTLSDDTFCDPTADTGDGQLEVKITGTPGIDVTEYLFRWWAGTDTTIAAMEITNAANFGGTIDVTAADSSAIEGLPSGKYTVVAYDANDPYNGCKSVATYTLKEDNPVYQIKLADIVTKDNDNCTGTTNGYIAIREIYVDGVAVDLATNGTDYTFTWSGNTTAGDGTLETVNAVGDSIGTVGAGTYTVFVTNTSAGGNACSSASVSVTIADDTENPLIELVTLSDDTFCDPTADTGDGQLEVKITGTPGIDVTEYLFRWWAGTDTTIAAMEITNAANFGGTIDVTAADSSAIEGLPSGKYTVVAYDANDPYNGCKSVATYTLKEDNPVYQIKLADIVTKDNDNCTGTTNGYIAIREIYVDGVAVDLATNGTDYTFTWSGNTTAGDGTLETVNAVGDSIGTVGAGTYTVFVTNTSAGGNACSSASVSVTIADDTENPLIELVTLSDDTFCDPTADTGDGQLEVKITGTPGIDVTEYLFRWWAGTDTTIAAMEITNAANFGGTIDVTAADSSAIEGLPSGKYTVVAYDANDPYNGCKSVATYTLKEDNPVYQIKLADIVTKDNDNCTGTTNGYIAIREIYVDGVAVDLATNGTDYTFTWSGNTTAGDGTLETVNAVGDSIGTVGAGTYTVFVTNTSAGGNACSSASVSVTIADDTENPLIELVTLSDDTFCDPTADTGDGQLEVKITGTPGIDVTEYLFRWWAGTDTTIAAMEITNAANFGGTIDVTAADSSAIEGLPSGKYTVVAYDANDPYNGCKSVATYTLKEDNPVYQIKLADIVTKDNDNCTGTTNGYIAIREIYVDGVAVDLATNGTDYTFTWSGNTTAGDGTLETVNAVGDSIGTVGAGTYTVFVTNTSAGGNACSSASVSVTIADDTENPLIELVTLSDDTFCDPTADTGDGQLEVKITGTPGIDVTEYLFRWWAGTDTTIAAMEITNAANFGGTIDVTAADSSAIEGLPSGKYTVVAYDANDPYNGCKSVATYTLKEDNPVYQIKLADIVTKDNDNCTGTTNGYIAIREIYVDGVAVDLATNGTDYTFTWSGNTTAGDGTLETVNAVGDSIGTVGAGTYTVFVENLVDNLCRSQVVNVTVGQDGIEPAVRHPGSNR